jgi:uncharacterized protein
MRPPLRIDRDVEMGMRDGVLLRGDVWRPDVDQPVPAIVLRTPYNRAATNSDCLRPFECVSAGYACVVQDTRGRYGSDGDWDIIMWDQEALDTYDTVEWVAAQRWCDGAVGMAGASYLGIVQWVGAAERPPHLRAFAPAMTTSGELDRLDTGGALRLTQVICWLAYMALDWVSRELAAGREIDQAKFAELVALVGNPQTAIEQLPLESIDAFEIPGFPITLRQMLLRGMDAVTTFRYDRVEAPTLSLVGWFDFLASGTIESFMRIRREGGGGDGVRGAHRLIVGPWVHDGNLPGSQGELNFGVGDGPFAGVSRKHLAFFDHHLRGAEDALPVVEYFLMGANEWRTAEDWPPPEVRRQDWLLSSGGAANGAAGDGLLARELPAGAAQADRYSYDPADPVPTHGGRVIPMGELVAGPFDQARIESRQDVLCYTTEPLAEPLAEPLDIVGPVTVRLFAATSAADTDWVGRLVDVAPDGRAIAFAEGIQRARFRDGPQEQLVEPGAIVEYRVLLGHTAWRVKPGHRLRLHLTSSNFPAFDRNMNTGAPVGSDTTGLVAEQTVFHTLEHPSALELTMLP